MKERPNGLRTVLWCTWDEFWQKTNICGINNAGNSRNSVLRRIVWIAIFCVFTGFTIRGVVDIVKEFQEYPVVTKVVVKHEDWVFSYHILYSIFLQVNIKTQSAR